MPAKIEQLIDDFWSPSGRDLAYQSLLEAVMYTQSTSQKEAASFILNVLPCLKDKNEAWKALQGILNSKETNLVGNILCSFGPAFKDLPDKNEAWKELHSLTLSRDIWVKETAAFEIGPAFAHIPEEFKEQAMKDLFRLARNSHLEVQESVAMSLGIAFPHLPDKKKAWDILVRMALEDDCDAGHAAAVSFKDAFPYVSDKIDAWEALLYIINCESLFSAYQTTFSLFSFYFYYPDKLGGYNDLIELLTHNNRNIRDASTISIGYVFQYLPDKVLAQKEFINLLRDEKFDFKGSLIISFGNSFSHLPDKNYVWEMLHQYVASYDESIRKGVAFSIGDACPDLPFPEKAQNDLLILAQDENDSVRMGVAHSLGFLYPCVDGDNLIIDCLKILAQDNDGCVRNRANYSLGKIFIYRASKTQNEELLADLLEKAVNCFEKASIEKCYFNPAIFCHFFYRSFNEVILKKKISREEIEKYIVNAKSVAKDSKNKKRLIRVIENLSDVLFSVQEPHKLGIESKLELVNYCRTQCDHAEKLMDKTKRTAPNLNELFHKIKPSFEQNIKELIGEVKEKAETACRKAKGTAAQKAICEINRDVQELTIGSQEYMKKQVQTLYTNLKSSVPDKEKYHLIHQEIDSILNEDDLVNQYSSLNMLLPTIIQINVVEATASVSEEMILLREIVDNKKIDEVLYDLYSPMGVEQKLKVAIPIIPLLASYELETNPPKLVADSISELKKLVMKGKKQ